MNPHWYSLKVCGFLPSSIEQAGPDARNVIADWQKAHGLQPDGEIGPKTADAMHFDALARGCKIPFTESEYLQGNAMPSEYAPNLRATMRMSCVLRQDVFGGVPVKICGDGGFRPADHDDKPGQANYSQHKLAKAADHKPVVKGSGTDPRTWYAKIREMMADGRLVQGGCKVYNLDSDEGPFAHCDWRGYPASW